MSFSEREQVKDIVQELIAAAIVEPYIARKGKNW
jgi:hypothetical protein